MAPKPVRKCSVTVYHRPKPVQIDHHHVWPLEFGGPSVAANIIDACPSCHTSIHSLLHEYEKAGGKPTTTVRRRYPFGVRRVAALGWSRIQRKAL